MVNHLVPLLELTPNSDAPFVSNWAGTITVAMTTIGAIILALIKRDNKHQAAKVEHITKVVTETVNAVNGTKKDEPPLIQKVRDLKTEQDQIKKDLQSYQHWMGDSMHLIGKQVGVIIEPYKIKEN